MANKLIKILKSKILWYGLSNFAKELIKHPCLMSRESVKCFSHWLSGTEEKPMEGLRFENHSHSHFSVDDNAADLSDVVDFLFDKKIGLWSLTDHGNSDAFDSLASGKYDLNKECWSLRKYELEVNPDRRSMIISDGSRNLVLLRSIEYETNKGEVGIHGYCGNFPNKSGLPLIEAIKRGIGEGGFVVINHPWFLGQIGFNKAIEEAVNAGAAAIEKNGCETLFQLYCPVRAELAAKKFEVPVITSGDAHKLYMYGKSGAAFNESTYRQTLKETGNHADAIKNLVSEGRFETYLNYLTPKELLGFFKF